MRKVDLCMNCKDEREIVAHGLCAKCYMRHKRNEEASDDPLGIFAGRSQRRYVAERNKMLVNLTRIIKLVDETPCLSHEDTATIKVTIQPYLLERANALAPMKTQPKLTVNTKSESTVNSDDQPRDATQKEGPKFTDNTHPRFLVNSDSGADPDLDPEPQPPKRKKSRPPSSTKIPKFGYPGGKVRMARKHIMPMLPPTGKRYIEPFAGRGNVYFAVAQLLHYEQFWLNDLQAASFLESLRLGMGFAGFKWEIPDNRREAFSTFKEELSEWKREEEDEEVRAAIEEGVKAMLELYTDPQSLEKALDPAKSVIRPSPYLVEPYLCFSGGTYRSGRRTTEEKAPSREGFERNVRLASDIMRRTRPRITGLDYKNVLVECGPDDVVYLDPPYLNAKVTAYSDKTLDHAEMVDILLNAKFKWLLSEYETPVYKPLGEPARRFDVQRAMANSGRGGGKPPRAVECLWKNF